MRYIEVDDPFYRVLHPRPAYLIVSGRDDDVNIMAASWVMPISEEPWTVGLALDRETYTYGLVKKYGEFTVNVVTIDELDLVYYVGHVSRYEVDKIRERGIELEPSREVSTPHYKGAIGYLECRVDRMIPVGEVDLVIGEVLAAYADKDLFTRYGWDLRRAKILMQNIGRGFTTNESRVYYASKGVDG